MFDYISGKVASVGENRVVIDCGGVGFLLYASSYTCADCSRKSEVRLPVYLAVREDALELYGFGSESERELFLLLISVSGVGPKLAIAILGGMTADRLARAVASGDVAALCALKGVGKKTAERIALELKGKLACDADIAVGGVIPLPDENAVLALMGLGYQRQEAETAVRKVAKPDMTTEQIVFAVLHG
ncbi:MAG: Holliday junction branch migration protein RuvA [Roseburia sp.]|nr:Holliday junction branch migration protein RuvA [Roseburia sp.]